MPITSNCSTEITVVDTDCLDITITGSGTVGDPYLLSGNILTGDSVACTLSGLEVVLSTDVDNYTIFGTDGGVYTPTPDGAETIIQVTDGQCIDVTLTGTGTLADPYDILVGLLIDASPENALSCGVTGLFAQSANLSVADTDCIDLTLTGTGTVADPWVISATPIIDATGSGLLTCTVNGLDVTPAILGVTDTDCIDLAITGTGSVADPYNISATPIVDPDVNNALECRPNGLFSPLPVPVVLAVLDTDCIDMTLTGSGTTPDPWVVSAAPIIDAALNNMTSCGVNGLFTLPTQLIVTDTQTVDLTLSGNGTTTTPWNIRADVIIDPDLDNTLITTGAGLFVPSSNNFVVVDSDCIDLTLTGDGSLATPFSLTASPIIDPAGSGLLSCGINGLNVTPTSVTVLDTDCIDVTLTGIGTVVDPYVISAAPIIDTFLTDNALSCGVEGLYVQTSGVVTVLDTDCIDLTLTGIGTIFDPYVISAAPIIDAVLTDNALSCGVDGLYVQTSGVVTVLDTDCIDATLTGTGTVADPYVISAAPIIDAVLTDNALSCGVDGLYVQTSGVVTVLDTDCIDATITGSGTIADPYVISAVPIVDAVLTDNALSCGVDGLYVQISGVVTVLDTDCIDATLTGTGTVADPYVISAAPIIDAVLTDNALSCGVNGLYVQTSGVLTVLDTDCIDLTVTGTGTVADPYIVSAAPIIDAVLTDNALSCGVNGLYVQTSGIVTVLDTDCIDLTVTGTGTVADPYVISAVPIVDAVATDNALSCGVDGLYVQTSGVVTVLDTDCIDATLTGTGTVADPYVISAAPIIDVVATDNAIVCGVDGLYVQTSGVVTVLDTDCIDATITGTGTVADPYVISAAPIIDAVATDNALSCGVNGLYVQTSGVVTVLDTDCIDITLAGVGTVADPYVISAAPIIDPAADNTLVCGPAGLYSPADVSSLTVLDTDCIDQTLTGTGTVADPWVLSAAPIIDPAADNTLVCGPAGLYSPADVSSLTVLDTDCIDITLTGVGTVADPWVLSAAPIIDPAADNTLVCGPAGLYSPADVSSLTVLNTDCISQSLTGTGTVADPWVLSAAPIIDTFLTDNALVCGVEGLYVQTSGVVTVLDTDCIDLTLTGTGQIFDPYVISAAPILSPGGDLECLTTGLAVKIDTAADNQLFSEDDAGNGGNGDGLYVAPSAHGEFELGIGCEAEVQVYAQVAHVPFRDKEIQGLTWYIAEGPVGADLIFDVLVNGVTVQTVTIADGTADGSAASVAFIQALAAGDIVTLEVTQVGSTTSGSGLIVNFDYTI